MAGQQGRPFYVNEKKYASLIDSRISYVRRLEKIITIWQSERLHPLPEICLLILFHNSTNVWFMIVVVIVDILEYIN